MSDFFSFVNFPPGVGANIDGLDYSIIISSDYMKEEIKEHWYEEAIKILKNYYEDELYSKTVKDDSDINNINWNNEFWRKNDNLNLLIQELEKMGFNPWDYLINCDEMIEYVYHI